MYTKKTYPKSNLPYCDIELDLSSISDHWSLEWTVWLLLLRETFIFLLSSVLLCSSLMIPLTTWDLGRVCLPQLKELLGPIPPHARATHGTIAILIMFTKVNLTIHVLWAGHFYSPCNEHHLHPCLASHCFYSDRAFVPSVICSSPVVLFPFSTSSCLPEMCGLTQTALLSGCSQLFPLLPLQIAYSHWRCTGQGHISVGIKITQSWLSPQDHGTFPQLFLGMFTPDLRPWTDCVIRRMVVPLKLFDHGKNGSK